VPSTDELSADSYACRTDPNSGVCGSDVISVCVSTHLSLLLDYLTRLVLVPQRRKLVPVHVSAGVWNQIELFFDLFLIVMIFRIFRVVIHCVKTRSEM
jgi:hypothetical protein